MYLNIRICVANIKNFSNIGNYSYCVFQIVHNFCACLLKNVGIFNYAKSLANRVGNTDTSIKIAFLFLLRQTRICSNRPIGPLLSDQMLRSFFVVAAAAALPLINLSWISQIERHHDLPRHSLMDANHKKCLENIRICSKQF